MVNQGREGDLPDSRPTEAEAAFFTSSRTQSATSSARSSEYVRPRKGRSVGRSSLSAIRDDDKRAHGGVVSNPRRDHRPTDRVSASTSGNHRRKPLLAQSYSSPSRPWLRSAHRTWKSSSSPGDAERNLRLGSSTSFSALKMKRNRRRRKRGERIIKKA